LIRQAASKTNDAAGDGTTTATVWPTPWSKKVCATWRRVLTPSPSSVALTKPLLYLVDEIAELAKPVEDSNAITQVGTISAGNDEEVGNMIAEAMDKVGREGVISLEEGKSMTTELEVTEGMRFDKGLYLSLLRYRHRAHGSGAG
jgi:chaperonin GroEL